MNSGSGSEGKGEEAWPSRWSTLWMLLGIIATFWAQFAWVRPTNFGGTDEWLCVSLASQGILDFPYANRPLVLLWALPGAWVLPHDLAGFYIVHAAYLALSGCLVFVLARYLAPRSPLFAFLAAVITVAWEPMDFLRLDSLLLIYSGLTFGTLLSMVLLVESWQKKSGAVLAGAALVGLVTARGYEGVVPLLAVAPLILRRAPGERRRFWTWVSAWEGVVAVAMVLILLPFLHPRGTGFYQGSALRLDANFGNVILRLIRQYAYHLLPLLTSPSRELAVPAVPLAVAVFALAYTVARRSVPGPLPGPEARGRLWALLGAGLLLAGLGYGLFVLTPSIQAAARTEYLSSPGIGIALAAGVGLAVTRLPARLRSPGTLLLGAWIVAVGTGRTVAMQGDWDNSIYFPSQHRTLTQLTAQAPHLKPHTLVLLIDEARAWPATLTFRHAVEYLYPGEASGLVWGASEFLYPAFLRPQGVFDVPWPVIWQAWGERPSLYRYDELLVVRLRPGRELSILERWPDDLPALPSGAAYAPWSRVETRGPLPPARAILARAP